jgi:hypothetical protein
VKTDRGQGRRRPLSEESEESHLLTHAPMATNPAAVQFLSSISILADRRGSEFARTRAIGILSKEENR